MTSPAWPRRKTLRLRGYDYSGPGPYFITVCTYERICRLGRVEDGEVRLSPIGKTVLAAWESLPERNPWIRLDASVVMPNHFHGIVEIGGEDVPDAASAFRRPSLPGLLAWFKQATSAAAGRCARGKAGPLWQRGYYEHIIRNERELQAIRAYIDANPVEWTRDPLFPKRPGGPSPPLPGPR